MPFEAPLDGPIDSDGAMETTMDKTSGTHPDTPILLPDPTADGLNSPARELPPHLAARFTPKSTTRRKSSAASSRRNSLSSSHSHSSRRASSTQSHCIAQQLRRSSILEDRRARLADRAAHCEQVRLRAALAKAAPRRNGLTSEERGMAAQAAREKYLAKVAAQCAEEVQRAKQKAQDMKARYLEEQRRTRRDMEDRLAEADKRRAEYQRNLHARRLRRSSSQEKKLAPVDEDSAKVLDRDTAAARIQRAWQMRRRKMVVEAWIDLNVMIDAIRHKDFEHVSSTIQDAKVIDATMSILVLFDLVKRSSNTSASDTRAFLSAYLMLAHSQALFGKPGPQENDLLAKAQELVVLFEAAVCRLAQWNRFFPLSTRSLELSQVYATYAAAFDAWKTKDSSALVENMVASFVELDAIWQAVKDDPYGNVAEDYKEGIRDNQVILLSRIRKLAGPERADVLIKKAIRESRRRRGRKRTAAEVRPRVAEDQTAASSTLEDVRRLSSDGRESGPQSFAALFSPIPSNRIITHELAVNKDYRIPTAKNAELRDQFNRGLCDSMRQGIEDGQEATWTTAMAECIRGKLLGILKANNPMHRLISEALDSDLIYQQCSRGMFSYDKFFDFMASVLPKLCAPFRDDQVKTLVEDLRDSTDGLGEMIEKLFRLLHFIDLLSLDYSNFLLMNAAPVLIREAAGYEQRMFAQDLAAGRTSLVNTKRWLRNATVNALTEADGRDPEQVRLLVDRPTVAKIHIRGLVDLATSPDSAYLANWPETLALDKDKILHLRNNYFKVVCIGAALLTAKNLLKRDVRAPWKAEATRLWDLTSKNELAADNLAAQLCSTIVGSKSMPNSSETYLQAAVARYCQQAATGRLTDPVLKVLGLRLKTHLFLRTSGSTTQERVRAASSAGGFLVGVGLTEFIAHVSDMVDLLGRVADVDFKGHEPWYEQVAREMRDAGDA